MKHLAKEKWKVSPEENVIHTTLPIGFKNAFSPNTDKERAKLIEAAPKMYKYILDAAQNGALLGCDAEQFLNDLGL